MRPNQHGSGGRFGEGTLKGMCPVCDNSEMRSMTWVSHTGTVWPARECVRCGAIVRETYLEPPGSGPRRKVDPDGSGSSNTTEQHVPPEDSEPKSRDVFQGVPAPTRIFGRTRRR